MGLKMISQKSLFGQTGENPVRKLYRLSSETGVKRENGWLTPKSGIV